MKNITRKNQLMALVIPSLFYVGDGEGDTGDGGDGDTGGAKITDSQEFKDAVAAAVTSAVDTATGGLKVKNDDLLKKLGESNNKIKAFGEYDPEAIQTMMKNFNSSEDAKLIAEGKFDELIAKKTDSMKANHDDVVNGLTEKLKTSEENGLKYKTQIHKRAITDIVQEFAIKTKAKPEAYDDICRRALDIFTVSETGEVEARDQNGELVKVDDFLLNPERFVNGLKKTNPYYWPNSESSDASGSGDDGFVDGDSMANVNEIAKQGQGGQLNLTKYRAASRKARGVKDTKK